MSGHNTQLRKHLLFAIFAAGGIALAVGIPRSGLLGQHATDELPDSDLITVTADFSQEWQQEADQVAILRGRCRITQGNTQLTAQKMVVWRRATRTRQGKREQLAVYLEDDVRVERPGSTVTDTSLFLDLTSRSGVKFQIARRIDEQPGQNDAFFLRALNRKQSATRGRLQPAQFTVPGDGGIGPAFPEVQIQPPRQDERRILIRPRTAVPFDIEILTSEETTPPEQIWILKGGINIIVEGIEGFGVIDLEADNMVVWTQAVEGQGFQAELTQARDIPFQVYMEGNIVVRQEDRVLRASQAFYDARDDRGLLLNAELRAFVPQLGGNIRVGAERIRQHSQRSFHARQAWTTTSEFGVPGYRITASDVFFEYRLTDPWLGLGTPAVDPVTGVPVAEETPWITSLNNTFLLEEVPLLYFPYVSGPAEDPNIPIRDVQFGHDRIFGAQARVAWDAFTLLGIDQPPGVAWDLLTDYYSQRGPAVGTRGDYAGTDLFGIPGPYAGTGLLYYVRDKGRDNLGRDRRNLRPETRNRGRALVRHRHDMPNNMTLIGEVGVLSDRNFLEQYFEREFDTGKDNETLLYLKQNLDNWAWSVLGRVHVNDFENQTAWLPRADLMSLSEPLFGGLMTWSSRSSVGYGRLRQAEPPTDPNDIFTPLPFITDADGLVARSRHEMNMPLNLGPIQVVPYALGEAAYWGEGFDGDDVGRLYGSAGVRGSILFSKIFPYVQSRVFNLNGLAHKSVLEADYYFADSTEDLANIPQYHEFDDLAQERFRQRLAINTFGGALPPQFEPRFYALRSGAGRMVTAPYHELVDDQQALRMAWRHRLQTKVGPPDRLRIKDWMTLDLEATFFPRPERDNFGEDFGLLSANYRWNVGERTAFLASAYYDLFDDAQQLWNIAVLSQRSNRGSVYVGLRSIEGAGLSSRIVTTSYSYVMGPKWISTFGTAFDVAEGRNRGQSMTITRVGADFLVHVGANYDRSKDNAGIAFSIEPRFGMFGGSQTQLNSLLGIW